MLLSKVKTLYEHHASQLTKRIFNSLFYHYIVYDSYLALHGPQNMNILDNMQHYNSLLLVALREHPRIPLKPYFVYCSARHIPALIYILSSYICSRPMASTNTCMDRSNLLQIGHLWLPIAQVNPFKYALYEVNVQDLFMLHYL